VERHLYPEFIPVNIVRVELWRRSASFVILAKVDVTIEAVLPNRAAGEFVGSREGAKTESEARASAVLILRVLPGAYAA
jgi:hypothetical protein